MTVSPAELNRRAEQIEFLRGPDEVESVYVKHVLHNCETSEGVQAFLQKRKSVWEHEQ